MDSQKKVLCVFTGHGPEDIRMLGGTAKWRLNTDLLLESCRYVVCVFNGAAQLPFAHGNPSARDNAAFLIGRIAGVEPVQEGDPLFYFGDQWEVPNRKLVRMSDVCMIDIPAFMPAWRNPTIYLSEDEVLEKLGIALAASGAGPACRPVPVRNWPRHQHRRGKGGARRALRGGGRPDRHHDQVVRAL